MENLNGCVLQNTTGTAHAGSNQSSVGGIARRSSGSNRKTIFSTTQYRCSLSKLHNSCTRKVISSVPTITDNFANVNSAGLERIDVPNNDAVLRPHEQIPRIPLVTKEEIEEVLVPHTERRFTQHQETPFGQGYRQRSLGVARTSADARALREGTYDFHLSKLTAEARTWLSELDTKHFVLTKGCISCSIDTDDVITGWARLRESTSSAPGGHYGHYKTASVAARLPEDHPDHTRVLVEIYSKMWTFPLKDGFAPQRWCRCIDTILGGKTVGSQCREIRLPG